MALVDGLATDSSPAESREVCSPRENTTMQGDAQQADASLAQLVASVDAEHRARPDAPGTHPEFDRLARTIWRLRQPDGCPWDREQTHATLTKHLVEEAYEAVEAVREGAPEHMCEEFGDVLEQVMLHAQVAADEGDFSIDDVCRSLNEKLIRRHPHVFGDATATTSERVLDLWDEVKRQERTSDGADTQPGLLDSVPISLPALMQAQKISRRAAKAGFEWESTADVWQKVAEERAEFEREPKGSAAATLEFGDLLFALVNVARHEGIDAEEALAASNAKFRRRWAAMERMARGQGKDVSELSCAEQNELWQKTKMRESSHAATDGSRGDE